MSAFRVFCSSFLVPQCSVYVRVVLYSIYPLTLWKGFIIVHLRHICDWICNRNHNHVEWSLLLRVWLRLHKKLKIYIVVRAPCECALSDTYQGARRIACLDSIHCAGCRAPEAYCPAERPHSGDSCLHRLNTFSYSLKHISTKNTTTVRVGDKSTAIPWQDLFLDCD